MSKIRPLSIELQKEAEEALNESPNRIPQDLKYLREWLKQQSYIKARTEDQWLLSFLRGCKFSLERTKEKLDLYYTMRGLVPEFFENRDPFLPEIQEILSDGCFWVPLPKTSNPAGPRVLLMAKSNFDPNKIHVMNAMKVNLMVLDILLNEDDNFVISGNHMLQSLKGMPMGYVTQMTPSFLKKTITCFHQGYPVRSKGFHFINAPSFSATLFNIIKTFLGEKLRSRVNVRSDGDTTNLHEHVPQSILPKEFGGDGGSLEQITAEWKKKIESYKDWFMDDARYCTDEAKRPGKPKTPSDISGVDGTFRKLDID